MYYNYIWPTWSRPYKRTPDLRVMKFTILINPMIKFFYYILYLSDQCSGVEERIFKNLFLIWTILPRPSTRTPGPRVMKFTILSMPKFLSKSCTVFSLYDQYGHTLEPLRQGSWIVKVWYEDPSLVIITVNLVCLIYAQKLRRLLKK